MIFMPNRSLFVPRILNKIANRQVMEGQVGQLEPNEKRPSAARSRGQLMSGFSCA